MANMNFGVNILPKANNTYTLGNSDYKWNIFANTLNGVSLTNIITDVQIGGTSIVNNNIAVIPLGGLSVLGVFSIDSTYGITANAEGRLYTVKANSTRIKEGIQQYHVIVPYNQHESVFYGLAKAAGDSTQSASSNAVGTYTDSAKTAIQNMLAVAPKANPVFTGSISLGRDANSTVGQNSVSLGYGNVALGNSSIAMGAYNYANADASVAIGYNNMAMGVMSFAGGYGTRAHGAFSYSFGLNTANDIPPYTNWTASTSYAVGDNVVNPEDNLMYTCIQANSDATFNYAKWIPIVKSTFIEKIGNGEFNITTGALGTPSNARALDWNGNEYLNGTLYVNCNNDSTGGTQVATTADLQNKVDLISNIVRGNPCVFDSPAEDLPLKSVELHFSYTQSGSGDPYPPGGGKNKFDKDAVVRRDGYAIEYDGTEYASNVSGYTENFIPVKPSTQYTYSGSGMRFPIYYNENKEFLSREAGQDTPFTFSTSAYTHYIRIQYRLSDTDMSTWQLEEGSSSTTYTPYSNIRPISGINNLFCTHTKKNMAQIRGYSAENKPYTAEGALSNSYGTTISTTSPESSLDITQSSSTTDYAKNHYRNGYVVFRTDNMVVGQYYDVSIKVTNITSNPLETALSELCLTPPSGGITAPTEIIGNVLIWKNMLYRDTNGIQSWEVRICGISCTISEFMVTPANTNDGVYEPYDGEKLDVMFPVLGKNLCPPLVKGIGVNGDDGRETTSATRATTDYIPIDFVVNPNYRFSGMPSSLTMWVSGYNANKEFVGRTASDKRIAYTITSSKFTEGSHAYTGDIAFIRLTFSAGSDASIDDVDSASIQLEVGDTTTAYEPYCDTVYNGSLDLISGVLTLTHAEYETTWGAGDNSYVFTTNERRRIALPFTCINGTWDSVGVCNVASWRWSFDSDTTHFYNHQNYSYVFLPIGTDDNMEIQIVGKLVEPVIVQLTPEQIKTFKGLNTIQSDVNGTIIIDSYMDLQGYKDSSLQDIQINGSSIISNKIANIPIASSSKLGAVKIDGYGLWINSTNGTLSVSSASSSQVKNGTAGTYPVTPSVQHESVFYGLAKAAGDATQSASSNTIGNYTDSARIAIQKMIFGYAIGPMEKIVEYTVAENSTSVSISTDLNGNEFKLAHAQVIFKIGTPTTNTKDYIRAYVLFKNSKSQLEKWGAPTLSLTSAGNTNCWMIYTFYSINGLAHVIGKSTNTGNTQPIQQATYQGGILPYISGFYVEQYSASTTLIPAGAQIIIYGCRYYD